MANEIQINDDLGFGTQTSSKAARLINADGTFNVRKTGQGIFNLHIYQWLVSISWKSFFAFVLAYYFLTNVIFGLLFYLNGIEHIFGAKGVSEFDKYLDCYFLSVQTFTTLGYGVLGPEGNVANLISAFAALFGLMSFALVTGLFFARFSKPSANIRFSEKLLLSPYHNGKALMFRMANKRSNEIVDISAMVSLTWVEETEEGPKRRFSGLSLERKFLAMLPLNWTIVHPINEKSILHKKSIGELTKANGELLVIIKAYDDTFAQKIQVNHSYRLAELVENVKFDQMFHTDADGITVFELDKIDEIKKVNI